MPNRLANSTSPYLLQHKDNPVDWWPWGEDAFAAARRRDVPILLSVGYSACHWCHVMAHESFENPDVAARMNAGFVCVKVDREERPDVDAVYMEATQALTGSGGWPMTCFLTPDGEPFFCGTYFPPYGRPGMPGFVDVLAAISAAWRDRREEVVNGAADISRELASRAQRPVTAGTPVEPELLDAAAAGLRADFDPENGGFGGAPKFPPSMVLEFLLRHSARTGDESSVRIVEFTCERMARGGMYDQLGGGFARYSVDAGWVVPHFEKMLYDNALLLRVYAHLWRATGSVLARRVATETAEFLLRDLRTPEGGFAAALDADSLDADGHLVEGAYYVWTPDELAAVLGPDDGEAAAELFGVTADGTFEHGRSVLQLPRDPAEDGEAAAFEWRARLLAARARRVPPGRDDKVVTSWNGLAIAALADAGALLDEPGWIAAAAEAADLLLRVHRIDGRLRRASLGGVAGAPAGVLDDYGNLAEGLLALHCATGEGRWLRAAGELLEAVLAHFADGAGGFYDTADDAERLVRRPRDETDGATPAGANAAAGAALSYAALTGEARYRDAAEGALQRVAPLFPRHARFAGWAAAVAEALLAGPLEVAVVDRPELARIARLGRSPGAVVVAGPGDATGVPLLAGRPVAAAYVCRGFVCLAPTSDPVALAREVQVADWVLPSAG